MRLISLYVVLLVLGSLVVTAQDVATGTLSGTVRNSATQSPVAGVTVTIVGTKLGAITTSAGKFTIKKIPAGIVSVRVSAVGYTARVLSDVVISTGKPNQLDIDITESAVTTQKVEVTGSYFQKSPEAANSTQSLSAAEVRRAPGVQEDVVRAVALLPGVAVTQAGRNDLVVRGGAPFENLFIVDNIEVPNINHFGSQGASGGPLTLVNIDFVRNVQFSAGGFGARYGDRVSSFTNITLRDGNDERFTGMANLSATGFGVLAEGPIGSSGSYMLNVRRSYLDLLFKALKFSFIPQYWDLTFKTTLKLDADNSVSFLMIGALDDVSLNNDSLDGRYKNSQVAFSNQNQYFSGITWKHLFANGFVTTTLGRTYTQYKTSQSDSLLNPIFRNNSEEGENSLNINLLYQFSPQTELNVGTTNKFASRLRYDELVPGFLRTDAQGTPKPLTVDTTFSAFRNGTFASLSTTLTDNLKTTVGLRSDYYPFLTTQFYVSPRLSFSYFASDVTTVNLSAGRYYQSPSFIWLIGDPTNANNLAAIRADQVVLGVEHQLRDDLKFQVEGFYKWYGNYPARVYRPQAVLSPSGFEDVSTDIPFGLEPLTSVATGVARGVEIFIQKKLSDIPLYGLASLTIAESRFTSLDGIERYSSFDSRFIFNLAAGYRFAETWELSAKFRTSQGLPTTPFTQQGKLDFTQYNAGPRLPIFHALDARIDKRWNFQSIQLVTYFDVQNVYFQKNVSRYVWNRREGKTESASNATIIPSLGINVEF